MSRVSLPVHTVSESSANIFTLVWTLSGRSLMYIRNIIGPKTDPCGTPLLTRDWEEYAVLEQIWLKRTLQERPDPSEHLVADAV